MDYRNFYSTNLWRLDDFLKMLPGVKPRKARERLKSWQAALSEEYLNDTWSGVEREVYKIDISKSLTLYERDFDNIFVGEDYLAKRITPHGARILCQVYKEGLFETNGRVSEFLVPLGVQDYIDSAESILEKQNVENALKKEAREKYEQRLINFESIKESEFSYCLLEDVFVKKFGYKGGHHTLKIGGINVTKSLSLNYSNSGLSSDWQVTFSWINDDGAHKTIQRDSVYSGNRRNDADRNYGLHE
jgi:hypothetical protein